jgi:DNA-binding GntR family transcriptional regulator
MINWRPEPERPVWIQVAEAIERRIHDGTYPPRTPIPSIVRIEQEFGVGKNTARHVVRYLADEGLVRPVPSMGTFVVPPHERPDRAD